MTGHEIDDKIKQALAAEDAELYAQFAEPSLLEQGLELLQSHNRWMNRLMLIVMPVNSVKRYRQITYRKVGTASEMLVTVKETLMAMRTWMQRT